MKQRSHPLVGLVTAFIGLAALYSLTTPLFEAPDEVWHYAYVRYLAEEHALPALAGNESGAYQEVAQPPLYYAVAALVSGFAPDDDLAELMWHNPGFGYQAGGTVNDNKNMLIHTERERFPWRGAVLAVRLARFVSLAFGLLTVVAAWGLGRETFPEQPAWALSVAAVVAFTPQFLFISGVVSNDSAAAALSTAALWAMARVANRGITLRRSLTIGLLIGLAALSKTSCLLLCLPATTVLLLAPRSPAQKTSSTLISNFSFLILTASAVSGWWYLRNALLYRDPFGFQVHAHTPWGRPTPASLTTLLAELPEVYRSFWGAFGWGHVEFPLWVYLALGLGLVFSLIGWVRMLRQRRIRNQVFAKNLVSMRIFLLATAWWLLVFFALLAWTRRVGASHGRLLFPAIGAWAVLLVGGWASLPPFRAWRWLPPSARSTPPHSHTPTLLFLTGLAALSLLTPWLVIRPAFAPPRLTLPAQAATTVQGTELTYGNAARLLGVSLDQTSVAPGDTLAVRACWEALAPMDEDYTVFIHLVGRENERVAERHTYPGLGRFPTSLWPVGKAFCDVYRVRVEDWAPVPELYDLVIGLYDASTGERLVARSPAGAIVGLPILAQVRVAPERPGPENELETELENGNVHPLDYRLDEQIALIGYRLSGPVRSGAPLTVTLYWRADERPAGDYTAFVHLLDEMEQPLAQHDGPPRYGRYPTSAWQPGDLVPDEHVLQVPVLPAGQPGKLCLVAGMYRPDTLERLPVLGPDEPATGALVPIPNDLIWLATVEIE